MKQDTKAERGAVAAPPQLWEGGNSGVRPRALPPGVTPDALIGQRYRILGPLGVGPLGRVFRAQQLPHGRHVALKIVNPELVSDPEVRARFLLEVATCAELSHPNIANVLDYGITEDAAGLHYVVAELCEGETLAELLARYGPLSPSRALGIARQIGRALRAAHKKGVVHRDLKPSSIMIATSPGGEDVVKVLDFGLALVRRDGDSEPSTLVRCYGTPGYMAPEQVTGDPVDDRADIYALGVIMFQMLTGTPPYHGGRAAEVLEAQLVRPLPSMAERGAPEVPPEIEELVRRCVRANPSERWPDIVSLMGAMRVVLMGEERFASSEAPEGQAASAGVLSILPSVPSPAAPAAPAPGPDLRLLLLTALVLSAAAFLGWQLTVQVQSEPRPLPAASGPRP